MRAERFARFEPALYSGFVTLLTFAAAAAFYIPALRATGGDWPAPLDDVFIHFDFARATARGAPFQWIAGQGFSSGETSPLYPFVLAFGYAIGFRGLHLGAWAAIVACASLIVMMRSLRELVVSRLAAWIGATMLVSIGVLDWSWFSGMEIALFGAAMMRTLVAVKRARGAPSFSRKSAEWRVGAWGAVLVLIRPEAAMLIAPLAVIVARRAFTQSAWMALVRASLPGALATLSVLIANAIFTGDPQSAGARLKLLSANPYLTDVDRARELVTNLVYVKLKVLDTHLTVSSAFWPLLPSLAVVALFSRRTRALAIALLAGGLGWTLLVSWNGAARFQNFRYYMPALAMLLVTSALGLDALSRSRFLRGFLRGSGIAAAIAGIALALPRVGSQITFFREASANIHDQQVEVGRRLASRMPLDARVLVGDAGAIPYLSDRHAIDALGLGAYRGHPFTRAATFGEAATIELIERLPIEERPSYLALYPNWFARTTSTFGTLVDQVTIEHNVICGGPTKGIYLADWSPLASADADDGTDVLDVGDVVSERDHDYESPAPNGGWTLLDVRREGERARLFDAGRITPDGTCERFTALHDTNGRATLFVRTDGDASADIVITHDGGRTDHAELAPGARREGSWVTTHATLPAGVLVGDRIALCAHGGPLHDFHVWVRPERLSQDLKQ